MAGCGDVVNLEGSTGPWKVVQALREQRDMSIPSSHGGLHEDGIRPLLSQQFGQQHDVLAVVALTAQTESSAVELTR